MTRDFADFLTALNTEGVAYVVIGGMAVIALIPYRTTRDIDVLIEPTLENATRARRAVARWAEIEPRYTSEEFISGDILSFGGLLRAEIHSRVPGADWAGVNARSEPGEFQGVPTRFACLEDLIAMKAAAGRPEKDLPDLRRLRKLQERKRKR